MSISPAARALASWPPYWQPAGLAKVPDGQLVTAAKLAAEGGGVRGGVRE